MRSVSSPRAVSMMIGTAEPAPQLAADVVAGAVGQHHVEQHEIGLDPPRELEGPGGGSGHLRVEALASEGFGQRLGDRLLVLDHEDRPSAGHRSEGRGVLVVLAPSRRDRSRSDRRLRRRHHRGRGRSCPRPGRRRRCCRDRSCPRPGCDRRGRRPGRGHGVVTGLLVVLDARRGRRRTARVVGVLGLVAGAGHVHRAGGRVVVVANLALATIVRAAVGAALSLTLAVAMPLALALLVAAG